MNKRVTSPSNMKRTHSSGNFNVNIDSQASFGPNQSPNVSTSGGGGGVEGGGGGGGKGEPFNRSMISRGLSPFSPMHFLKKFHTGVTCVMVDFHMQIIGTFDIGMTTIYPGLDFEPAKLGNSKTRDRHVLHSRYDRLSKYLIALRTILLFILLPPLLYLFSLYSPLSASLSFYLAIICILTISLPCSSLYHLPIHQYRHRHSSAKQTTSECT